MNELEPDLAIVRARPDGYMTALPGPEDVHLVIEVADTSLAWDLGVKVPLYARHGIPEAWVIDAGCEQRLSTPPRLSARDMRCTPFSTRRAASSEPTSNESIPPNPCI